MRRVLVLRPEPGASLTVDRARRLGLKAIAVPLFAIEPVPWDAPDVAGFDGLLITSVNAIRHAGLPLNSLRGLPVYAVGKATAAVARSTGFQIAATGEGGVDWLLGSTQPDLKLLHLCGADRLAPAHPKQKITAITVYRSVPVQAPDLAAAEGSVAMIHSPRAAGRFAELVSERSRIAIAAISFATAETAGGGWESVSVAEAPEDEALLALAARLCNNPHPK